LQQQIMIFMVRRLVVDIGTRGRGLAVGVARMASAADDPAHQAGASGTIVVLAGRATSVP
jgi:hypothetical protein